MNRRDFVRNSFLISGGALVAPSLLSQTTSVPTAAKKITILHTNDTHSNIDPFPSNHSKYPGMGGVSRRFELIQKIRAEEDNVLLLDAGDIFQGTPYFNKYGGVLEMKLMTELGYDAATMGNHDFDGGMEGFVNAKTHADFPFLCSNYDFTNTPINGLTQQEIVIEKGGVKIGLFGIGVELEGLVPANKFGETKYQDPIDIANDRAASLKKKGCDLIICLSHLGYSYDTEKISDLKLAAATKDIHLIIGGHTHTFLEEPTVVENASGETTLVNQVGWAGVQLGRLDFEIEGSKFARKERIEIK